MERGTFREDLYYRLNVVEVAIPPLRERREDIPNLLSLFVEKYGKRYGRSAGELPTEILDRFSTYDFPGNIRELENLVRRLMVLRDPRYVLSELKERAMPAPAAAATPAPTATATAAPAACAPVASAPAPLAPPAAPSYSVLGGHAAVMASPFNSPSPLPPPTIPPPPAFRTAQAIAEHAGAEVATQQLVDDYKIDLKDLGRKAAHAAEREAIIIMLGHTGGNKREAAERLGISYKAILYKIREFGIGRPRAGRPSRPRPATSETDPAAATSAVVVPTTAETWSTE